MEQYSDKANKGQLNCLALYSPQDNKVEIVANDAGERVTPAVVCIQDEEVVTGLAAKQGLVRHGPRTIVGILKAISASGNLLMILIFFFILVGIENMLLASYKNVRIFCFLIYSF